MKKHRPYVRQYRPWLEGKEIRRWKQWAKEYEDAWWLLEDVGVQLEATFEALPEQLSLAALNPEIEPKQKEDCTGPKPVPKIPFVPEKKRLEDYVKDIEPIECPQLIEPPCQDQDDPLDDRMNGIRALYRYGVFIGQFRVETRVLVKRGTKRAKKNPGDRKKVIPVVDLNLNCKLSNPFHRNLLTTIRILVNNFMQVTNN